MSQVTTEELQAENRRLAQELIRREVADVLAKQAAREEALKAAAAKDQVDRLAAQAAEVEATRRNAWLHHYCNETPQAFISDVLARAERETPPFAWPPGQSAADYGYGYAAGRVPDDVSQTSMFKKAQKLGVKF